MNFHVGDDEDAQADHQLTGNEAAGLDSNRAWNNINVGPGGRLMQKVAVVFKPTSLADDTGDRHAATLAPSALSTWFVGYAASHAASAEELGLAENHDDLYNSYLALNGPDGDGTPADAAVLKISGLSEAYTANGYKLIIYSDTDKGPVTKGGLARTSRFAVTPSGGSQIVKIVEDYASHGLHTFDGTYVESDDLVDGTDYSNYVVFSGLTADSFELSIFSEDGGRGGISGFQIVALPEPYKAIIPESRSYAIFAGLMAFVCVMLRRRLS